MTPMISESDMRRLADILSTDAVGRGDPELRGFRTSNPLVANGRQPDCVLRPRNVEQLQAIVRLAAGIGLRLVPVSSSPPHTSGAIACDSPHAVVDLSSWKRIDYVDRRNRVCMVGPGVTYGQLLEELEPHGLTVPMPLAPRATKSVVAAVMDRTPSTWPNKQWDVGDPVACTELVFGTGDRFRTGAAGGPGSLDEQRRSGGAQKSPIGPSQTDLHRVVQGSQGSMAIVTWITLRAEVRPSVERPLLIGADRLEPLVPILYQVHRPWLGEHSFVLNDTAAAMLLAAIQDMSLHPTRRALPAYVCLQNIAGFERQAEERVEYQQQDIDAIVTRGGLALVPRLGAVTARALLSAATRPCDDDDWRRAALGHCLSVFFLTTLDRTPGFVSLAHDVAGRHDVGPERVGIYLQPAVQNHCCHMEIMVPFDPGDAGEVARMADLEAAAVRELSEAGAFFSRPYGPATDVAFASNPIGTDLLTRIKGVFDPAGVLGPGNWMPRSSAGEGS